MFCHNRKKMRNAATQNQEIFTQIHQPPDPALQHNDVSASPYSGKQGEGAAQPGLQPVTLASGLVTTTTLPSDNDYSYVKDMWPANGTAVGSAGLGGRAGTLGRKPISATSAVGLGPIYQTQHIRATNSGSTVGQTATLDRSRSPRLNVRFRDDMSLKSIGKGSRGNSRNEQHIYESPDTLGKGFRTTHSCNPLDPVCTCAFPHGSAGHSSQMRSHGDFGPVTGSHEINDNEEVWQRRSAKNTTIVL